VRRLLRISSCVLVFLSGCGPAAPLEGRGDLANGKPKEFRYRLKVGTMEDLDRVFRVGRYVQISEPAQGLFEQEDTVTGSRARTCVLLVTKTVFGSQASLILSRTIYPSQGPTSGELILVLSDKEGHPIDQEILGRFVFSPLDTGTFALGWVGHSIHCNGSLTQVRPAEGFSLIKYYYPTTKAELRADGIKVQSDRIATSDIVETGGRH